MWIADQNREQFLNMLQFESAPASVVRVGHIGDAEESLRLGLIRLIWNHEPRHGILPAILVIPQDDWREFFAWCNTYLGGWCPISGLFRVIADRSLRDVFVEKLNHEVVREYRNAALGMILCEAGALSVNADRQQSRSTLTGCLATCSFAMGRAMYLGRQDLAMVAQSWHRARSVTRKRVFDQDVRLLVEPWSVLLEVAGVSTSAQVGTPSVSRAVVTICRSLQQRDEIDSAALKELTNGWTELEEAFRHMKETRERRVQSLEIALTSVDEQRKRSSQPTIIALGLLASRIAPGTLEHGGLLSSYAAGMRGLMLWFGLFTGVTRGARVIDHHEGLGRRILRDMLADDTVFSSPSCDIAIDELEIISSSESALRSVPRVTADRLGIEILPCVNTIAPWLTSERREGPTQMGLFDDETRLLESNIRELNYAADNLLRRLRRLGRRIH